MALFITFEGGEGCGKTFQAKALYRRLQQLAIPSLLTHEPGGTPLGEKVSRWVKWSDHDISPFAELLLFNAARAQLVNKVIRPSLERGEIVICDRYADSTVVYQGYGRGLDLSVVEETNYVATQGLTPKLTILLDIDVTEGLARKGKKSADRFEKENIFFHQKVRDGYLKLAADEPERWLVIDAAQSKAAIREIIWRRVTRLLLGQGRQV